MHCPDSPSMDKDLLSQLLEVLGHIALIYQPLLKAPLLKGAALPEGMPLPEVACMQ